jgi:pimeloyl-ACP methyl ester carboxylesterase
MAARIDALVTHLGLDDIVLIGNSLGGAVSLAYALAHPERLRALVLVDSIGFPMHGAPPPALAAARRPLLGPLLIQLTPRAAVKKILESTYGDPTRLSAAEVTAYHDMSLRAGNRTAGREVLLRGAGQGLAPRVKEIQTPTLILWGGKDTWAAPENADWFMQQLPQATLVRFPALGHLPMAEDPAQTAAALRDFLATHPPRGR